MPNILDIGQHKSFIDYKDIVNNIYSVKHILFFMSIRNPWSRYLSWYFHHTKGRTSLDDFIRKQSDRLMLPNLLFFQKGITSDISLHYIRFESLQADFDNVCDILDIPRQKLPHYNNSNHIKPYSYYYSTFAKDFVSSRYQRDIEFFKYKFE